MVSRHRNQLSIYNPETDGQKSVLIVGAWWIWSTTTYALAQMWVEDIMVVDFDEVENHNIASQFYKQSQLGKLKTESLRDNVKEFTWVEIEIHEWKFESELVKWRDIVILAVDNMKTRKEVVEACGMSNEMCIDCRMKAEFFEVYVFNPALEQERYMQDWYSDKEASEEVCTEKWVSYNWLWIASIITRIVKWIIKWDTAVTSMYSKTVDLHNFIIC